MHRILLSLLFGLTCTTLSYAQLFFTPGYVVTASGDTLRGELRVRDNVTLDFHKISRPIHEQTYTPDQVSAYASDNLPGRSVAIVENGARRYLFTHEIISGHVRLFELIKPEGRLNYIAQVANGTYIPLRGNLALINLTQHLTECSDLPFRQLMSPRSFYTSRGYLERVIRTYNACVTPGQAPVSSPKRFRVEAGILAGAALNSWYYGAVQSRLSPYWYPNGPCSAALAPVFGGYVTLMPHKRLSLVVEVSYSSYQGARTVKITNPADANDPATRRYSFQEQYLMFPITGRYQLTKQPLRTYLKGGVGLSYALRVKGEYSGGNIVRADIPIRAGVGVGWLGGIGAEVPVGPKRRLLVEIRMAPHLVMDRVTRMANSRSLQLTVGVPLARR